MWWEGQRAGTGSPGLRVLGRQSRGDLHGGSRWGWDGPVPSAALGPRVGL